MKLLLLFLILSSVFSAPAARTFNGSTDKLMASSAVVGGAPLTIAAWFNASSLAADSRVVSISINIGSIDQSSYMLFLRTTGQIRARTCNNAGICFSSTSAASVSTGTWNHGVSVFASGGASRTSYLNGTAATADTNAEGTLSTLNTTTIGGTMINLAFAEPFAGSIGEVAVWNVALTQNEITSLASGFSPKLIRPQSLIEYVPIWGIGSTEYGSKGTAFAVTGTSAAAHPRMFYDF